MAQDSAEAGGVKQNLDYNQNYTLKDPDHDEIKDGYQLRWVGKDYAKLQENLRPETVVVPDSAHNAKPLNAGSENLFLTGDNLEVLKHLEHAYTGAIDLIYIDPPYNTGSDGFVYSDNFSFTDEQLRDILGLTEEEVTKIRNLYGKASHSAWLTFMYPRLKLAKKLLKDSGVIFVSIDDNEQANLKLLMDAIFGEGRFVASFIWKKKGTSTNVAGAQVSSLTEYVLAYSGGNAAPISARVKTTEDRTYPYHDEEGNYRTTVIEKKSTGGYNRETMKFKIIGHAPRAGKRWQMGEAKARRLEAKKRFMLEEGIVKLKIYDFEDTDTSSAYPNLLLDAGSTQSGQTEADELLGPGIFDTPKPTQLIEHFISIGSPEDATILDFFAGSGTTAQAVMKLNQNGDSRRYIVCTLDEPVNPKSEAKRAGYETVDQIARTRIERAAEMLGDESGFKHYRFVVPAEKTLEQIDAFDPSQPTLVADDMVAPFSEAALTGSGSDDGVATLLSTWLVDDGYPFDTAAEALELEGYKAYYAPGIARLYLVDNQNWSSAACKALLNKLGTNEIAVNAVVIYAYSFGFVELTELKNNLKANLDKTPQIIERY